jgi:hypothetical protein
MNACVVAYPRRKVLHHPPNDFTTVRERYLDRTTQKDTTVQLAEVMCSPIGMEMERPRRPAHRTSWITELTGPLLVKD